MGDMKERRKSRILGDLTAAKNNENAAVNVNGVKRDKATKGKDKDHVRERVRDWEREKERLREMSRLEELERERDEQIEEQKESAARQKRVSVVKEREQDKENTYSNWKADNTAATSVPYLPSSFIIPSATLGNFFFHWIFGYDANAVPDINFFANDSSPRLIPESSLTIFKHSIKKSIGWFPACTNLFCWLTCECS